MSSAVVAAILDVVILGQWRDHGGASGDLADVVQDDFRAAVVEFYCSVDFDGAAGQAANVADIFQSGREHYYAERASRLFLAEVEEVNSLRAHLNFEDFAGNTFRFANVLAGFVDGDAIGGVEWGRQKQQHTEAERI